MSLPEQAEQVKARLAVWLAPRGLVFNEDKTRIVHLDEGFDFLGFNVRRYDGKLLIKPSKAALRRIRERLSAEMRALRGANAERCYPAQPDHPGLVGLLPACGVHQGVQRAGRPHVEAHLQVGQVHSPEQAEALDHLPVLRRVQPARRDRWVFGDRDSGAYLLKFAWTKIVRHTMVKGWASPDDPALADYWAARRRRGRPRWTGPGYGLSSNSMAAVRSVGSCCCTPTEPQPPRMGTVAHSDPQGDPPPRDHRDTGPGTSDDPPHSV